MHVHVAVSGAGVFCQAANQDRSFPWLQEGCGLGVVRERPVERRADEDGNYAFENEAWMGSA